MSTIDSAASLRAKIKACILCAKNLPHGPRPVTSWSVKSRILIIGQAPGRVVHESGVPRQDVSGRVLRNWLSVSDETFYDPEQFGLMPMGFCYPGKGKSGDLPPRPECAPLWHDEILDHLKQVKLTILIGKYAQNYYLGKKAHKTLTENVKAYKQFWPEILPLPHPSPRNRPWLFANPWFEKDLIPLLQKRVRTALSGTIAG